MAFWCKRSEVWWQGGFKPCSYLLIVEANDAKQANRKMLEIVTSEWPDDQRLENNYEDPFGPFETMNEVYDDSERNFDSWIELTGEVEPCLIITQKTQGIT